MCKQNLFQYLHIPTITGKMNIYTFSYENGGVFIVIYFEAIILNFS